MIHHFDTLPSTQDYMLALARRGAPGGTAVWAEQQTAGKGTGNNLWVSPKGGLWFSLLLRPDLPARNLHGVTWVIALAVIKWLKSRCGVDAWFHVPNDIYLDGRKLGGILCQSQLTPTGTLEYLIIGIGINLNLNAAEFPKELQPKCITVNCPATLENSLHSCVSAVTEAITSYSQSDLSAFLAEISRHCYTLGKTIAIDGVLRGTVTALTSRGTFILNGHEELPAARNVVVIT